MFYKAIPQDSKARLAGRVRQGGSLICPRLARHAPGYMVLEGLEKEARKARKGLWWNRIPCRRGRGGIGNRVSGRLTGWRWRVLRHSQRDTNCRPKYVR
jgi:hypothetical protein